MKVAEEANPLMAYFIDISPSLFLAIKILAVTLSCLILWNYRACYITKYISFFAMTLYTGIIAFHLYGAADVDIITWEAAKNSWSLLVTPFTSS